MDRAAPALGHQIHLPPSYLLAFGVITALYLIASEVTKKFIYRRAQFY